MLYLFLLYSMNQLYTHIHSPPLGPPTPPDITEHRAELPLLAVILHAVASLVAQLVKNPPAMRETWVRSLGWEDPLEKGMATHSSILAWRIPWTMGLQRVGHNWVTFTFTSVYTSLVYMSSSVHVTGVYVTSIYVTTVHVTGIYVTFYWCICHYYICHFH